MADSNVSPQERAHRSFQKLSESAKALNKTSDQLSFSIAELDSALQKLNLGVSQWIKIHEETKSNQLITRHIGYDRVNGNWGISLQSIVRKSGSTEPTETSRWLFNEGPRWLRIRGIEKIPELLDALAVETDKHKALIEGKLQLAKELAASVKPGGSR